MTPGARVERYHAPVHDPHLPKHPRNINVKAVSQKLVFSINSTGLPRSYLSPPTTPYLLYTPIRIAIFVSLRAVASDSCRTYILHIYVTYEHLFSLYHLTRFVRCRAIGVDVTPL